MKDKNNKYNKYEKPSVEIIRLDLDDVIKTSGLFESSADITGGDGGYTGPSREF